MNWERVPLIVAALSVWRSFVTAMHTVFIRFPLYMIGYKACCICKRRISPLEKLVKREEMDFFAGYERTVIDHYCTDCDELRRSA